MNPITFCYFMGLLFLIAAFASSNNEPPYAS